MFSKKYCYILSRAAEITQMELTRIRPKQMVEYLTDIATNVPLKRSRMSKQVWLSYWERAEDGTLQDIQKR